MKPRRPPAKDDAGIVPMGIPMLAGPGAITSVMVLVGQAQDLREHLAIYAGDHRSRAAYLVPRAWQRRACRAQCTWGRRAYASLCSIMGLLLVALAVQDFVNGLVDLGVHQQTINHRRILSVPQQHKHMSLL